METKEYQNYNKLIALLNRLSHLLKNIFRDEWHMRYEQIWCDQSNHTLIKLIGNRFLKIIGITAIDMIQYESIENWNHSLLIELLLNRNLFRLPNRNRLIIEEFECIYRNLMKYLSTNNHYLSDDMFDKYWQQIYIMALRLNDNEDDLIKLRYNQRYAGIELCLNESIDENSLEESKRLRSLANGLFENGNYEKAIELYNNALNLKDITENERALLFTNCFEAYMKLNNTENAVKTMYVIVKHWPEWWRIYRNKDSSVVSKEYSSVEFNEHLMCVQMLKQMNENVKLIKVDILFYFNYFNTDKEITRQSIVFVLRRIRETTVNRVKVLDKYDYETIVKHMESGSQYANKLLKAKNHYLDAIIALVNVSNDTNSSTEDWTQFVCHLSECAKTEYCVSVLMEPMKTILETIIGMQTDFDENARLCYLGFDLNVETRIAFLNECIELYPNNAYFYKYRASVHMVMNESHKCLNDITKASELLPNNEHVLYLLATAMKKSNNYSVSEIIKAFNNFIEVSCNDHQNIAKSYYTIAYLFYSQTITIDDTESVRQIRNYFIRGTEAEKKQLSFFKPISFASIKRKRLYYFLEYEKNRNIVKQSIMKKLNPKTNRLLTKPYRIEIIKEHRLFIKSNKNMFDEQNSCKSDVDLRENPCLKQLPEGFKQITLKEMDNKVTGIYKGFVIHFRSIEFVGCLEFSLSLVVEDINKDVERFFICNSQYLNNLWLANRVYGVGSQFSVINPIKRVDVSDNSTSIVCVKETKQLVMNGFIESMCRFCGETNAKLCCTDCSKAYYCNDYCLENDLKLTSHQLICF